MTKIWFSGKKNYGGGVFIRLIEIIKTEQLCVHVLYRFDGQGEILEQKRAKSVLNDPHNKSHLASLG